MLVSGETIDYGPCAFMNSYDPETVFSSIDHHGRYAYGNQPPIAAWNLTRFAETLLPLIDPDHNKATDLAKEALSQFASEYHAKWLDGMRKKLGLCTSEEEDEGLIIGLLNWMHANRFDYTNTFLTLMREQHSDTPPYRQEEFVRWHKQWMDRLKREPDPDLCEREMKKTNPAVIPRNHRVEEALDAAVSAGDYSVMDELLDALSKPYDHSRDLAYYAQPPEPSNCRYQTFCGT
jgi:uncharacterized protein YdiU (UPF0061 family)